MNDFRIDLRVRFAETDAMGVAHHAAYLPWLDGLEVAVVGVNLRYHAPLRFDDEFMVSCTLAERARATFSLAYRVELGELLVLSGRTRHAVLDRATGTPRRLPEWLAVLPPATS